MANQNRFAVLTENDADFTNIAMDDNTDIPQQQLRFRTKVTIRGDEHTTHADHKQMTRTRVHIPDASPAKRGFEVIARGGSANSNKLNSGHSINPNLNNVNKIHIGGSSLLKQKIAEAKRRTENDTGALAQKIAEAKLIGATTHTITTISSAYTAYESVSRVPEASAIDDLFAAYDAAARAAKHNSIGLYERKSHVPQFELADELFPAMTPVEPVTRSNTPSPSNGSVWHDINALSRVVEAPTGGIVKAQPITQKKQWTRKPKTRDEFDFDEEEIYANPANKWIEEEEIARAAVEETDDDDVYADTQTDKSAMTARDASAPLTVSVKAWKKHVASASKPLKSFDITMDIW